MVTSKSNAPKRTKRVAPPKYTPVVETAEEDPVVGRVIIVAAIIIVVIFLSIGFIKEKSKR